MFVVFLLGWCCWCGAVVGVVLLLVWSVMCWCSVCAVAPLQITYKPTHPPTHLHTHQHPNPPTRTTTESGRRDTKGLEPDPSGVRTPVLLLQSPLLHHRRDLQHRPHVPKLTQMVHRPLQQLHREGATGFWGENGFEWRLGGFIEVYEGYSGAVDF